MHMQQRFEFLQRTLIRPIPLFLVQPLLAKIVAGMTRTHPRIFSRLGIHSQKTFLIRPTNMPFVLVLRPSPMKPELFAKRNEKDLAFDACIAGSFLNLLKLVEARIDGDALFFSRSLIIEGDTEAVVCLRNALDDMESNVIDEAAKALGHPAVMGLQLIRKIEGFHHDIARQKA